MLLRNKIKSQSDKCCLTRAEALHITLGLCAGVALEFLPPETAARLFDKDKY